MPVERNNLQTLLDIQGLRLDLNHLKERVDGIETQLETRAGRIERFLLGGLIFIALAVATPLVALVIRSGGGI